MARRVSPLPRVPIRLVVLDVDGTLLDSTGTLRPRVIDAVRAVQTAGCLVTLATGRRLRSARPVARDLGITAPLILHGGALIVEPESGRIRRDVHLATEQAGEAVARLTARGWQPIIYGNGYQAERLYSGPPERDDAIVRRYLTAFPEFVTRLPLPELRRVPDPLGLGVLGDPERLAEAERLTAGIPGCRSFVTAFQRFGSHLLEVVSADCSKGSAIAWFCREYGLLRESVLAIGDHRNDLEMIEAAGFGVAMGDAPPAVQDAADAVTVTADDDGVALALERYVLQQSVAENHIG